jgi:hypothetical protein
MGCRGTTIATRQQMTRQQSRTGQQQNLSNRLLALLMLSLAACSGEAPELENTADARADLPSQFQYVGTAKGSYTAVRGGWTVKERSNLKATTCKFGSNYDRKSLSFYFNYDSRDDVSMETIGLPKDFPDTLAQGAKGKDKERGISYTYEDGLLTITNVSNADTRVLTLKTNGQMSKVTEAKFKWTRKGTIAGAVEDLLKGKLGADETKTDVTCSDLIGINPALPDKVQVNGEKAKGTLDRWGKKADVTQSCSFRYEGLGEQVELYVDGRQLESNFWLAVNRGDRPPFRALKPGYVAEGRHTTNDTSHSGAAETIGKASVSYIDGLLTIEMVADTHIREGLIVKPDLAWQTVTHYELKTSPDLMHVTSGKFQRTIQRFESNLKKYGVKAEDALTYNVTCSDFTSVLK